MDIRGDVSHAKQTSLPACAIVPQYSLSPPPPGSSPLACLHRGTTLQSGTNAGPTDCVACCVGPCEETRTKATLGLAQLYTCINAARAPSTAAPPEDFHGTNWGKKNQEKNRTMHGARWCRTVGALVWVEWFVKAGGIAPCARVAVGGPGLVTLAAQRCPRTQWLGAMQLRGGGCPGDDEGLGEDTAASGWFPACMHPLMSDNALLPALLPAAVFLP